MSYFVEYPFENAPFFKKSIEVDPEFIGPKMKNCTINDTYKKTCDNDVIFGNEKPIDEECAKVDGRLNYEPGTSCSSVWNNLTRRKSLVKDY